jgi:(1->4)-alpha-D-glucan 1-alpha-D-glucosylmutase
MRKALREAKRNTSWVSVDEEWELAVEEFVRGVLADTRFLSVLEPLCRRAAPLGERISVGQLVLKLTAPGVPDIYQGDELPFFAFVDPDNRRPVDWDWSQAALRRLMGGGEPGSELRKMWHVLRLLGLRARRPDVFEPPAGGYEPLDAGSLTCAFVRGGAVLVVVYTRPGRPDGLMEVPGGEWRDVHTGELRSFSQREPIEGVVGARGLAVFERT